MASQKNAETFSGPASSGRGQAPRAPPRRSGRSATCSAGCAGAPEVGPERALQPRPPGERERLHRRAVVRLRRGDDLPCAGARRARRGSCGRAGRPSRWRRTRWSRTGRGVKPSGATATSSRASCSWAGLVSRSLCTYESRSACARAAAAMSLRPCPSVAAIEPPLMASRNRRPGRVLDPGAVAADDHRVAQPGTRAGGRVCGALDHGCQGTGAARPGQMAGPTRDGPGWCARCISTMGLGRRPGVGVVCGPRDDEGGAVTEVGDGVGAVA